VAERLAHDVRQGIHARRVMESYQTWFGEGPEMSVLRMLGLFDRPADEKALLGWASFEQLIDRADVRSCPRRRFKAFYSPVGIFPFERPETLPLRAKFSFRFRP
jgi:hypothetical protein